MSQSIPYVMTPTLPVQVEFSAWEKNLIEKVRQLRLQKKRAMILIDERSCLVYQLENAGTVTLE